MNEDFSDLKPAGLEEQPVTFNNNYPMRKIMENNQNVDAIVNGISFLGGAYSLGKSLVGKRFNILDFKTDGEIIAEAKAAFNFIGTLPQAEAELVDTITPDEAALIGNAILATGLLKPNSDVANLVPKWIAWAALTKSLCEESF